MWRTVDLAALLAPLAYRPSRAEERPWETRPLRRVSGFRAVTYNVLADALTGNEAGFSSETEDLAFENRAGKLLKKIFPREDE